MGKARPERRVPEGAREIALALVRSWGRQGGKLRWKGVSSEKRRQLARKAARARWAKVKQGR